MYKRQVHEIQGVNQDQAESIIKSALELLSSQEGVTYHFKNVRVVLDIAVIVVKKSREILLCEAGAYIRADKETKPMSQVDIQSRTHHSMVLTAPIASMIERQTQHVESLDQKIESLTKELEKKNGWKSRIKDGAIGAVISLVFTNLIGL